MRDQDYNLSDSELVGLVLAGERDAFAPLLLRHYRGVLRLCSRLLGPGGDVQDVAQEAALQAFLGLARLREPERFGAWLHAIAANLARMSLRRRRLLSLDTLGEGELAAGLWVSDMPTPEDVHAAREVHDAIVGALNELPAINREAVVGFYMEGYTYVELAELLGVPVSTVKGRLSKGRRRLQRSLASVAQGVLKPVRTQQEVIVMEAQGIVRVQIEEIRRVERAEGAARIVLLHEEGTPDMLPIWIGDFEASSIELAMGGGQSVRPLTHDLALRMLESLRAKVQQVLINKLLETTFYAEITLAQDERVYTVDARPSDALALAVRTGAPIYVARDVLATAGFNSDEKTLEEVEAEEKRRAAMTDTAPVPRGEDPPPA